jgi:siroheme synthase-like protein
MKRDEVGLQVTLDVDGKRALVVGGGDEALDKVERLLDGGAVVTVVARDPGSALTGLAERGRLLLLQREFFPADVREADLVLICDRDPQLAERAHAVCDAEGAALWVVDDPARSHFAMPALARAGKLRVAVSTSGASPALAGAIRAALERDLDARFRAFLDQLAAERARLLAEEPDPAARRERLRALVAGFDLRLALTYPG